MDKFESKVTRSSSSAAALFARFATLEGLTHAFQDERIRDVQADEDRCTFTIQGLGQCGVQIVRRDPFKCVKYGDLNGRPTSFSLWIQFVEVGPADTRIRLTLHAELPMFIRMMAKKKIQSGLDQIAERVASIVV